MLASTRIVDSIGRDKQTKSMLYTMQCLREIRPSFEPEWRGSAIKSEEGVCKAENGRRKMQKDRSHILEDPSKPEKETNCLSATLQGETHTVDISCSEYYNCHLNRTYIVDKRGWSNPATRGLKDERTGQRPS